MKMQAMLLNKWTKVVSVGGDQKVSSYDEAIDIYENIVAGEVEVAGGFKLVGNKENGDQIECFLSTEDYFEGKQFKIV